MNHGDQWAFPTADNRFYGMTLRDYFAAKAMAGMIAEVAWSQDAMAEHYPLLAKISYDISDAMISERNKE